MRLVSQFHTSSIESSEAPFLSIAPTYHSNACCTPIRCDFHSVSREFNSNSFSRKKLIIEFQHHSMITVVYDT